jgi:Sec-independent protein secretion pathway component TatC
MACVSVRPALTIAMPVTTPQIAKAIKPGLTALNPARMAALR